MSLCITCGFQRDKKSEKDFKIIEIAEYIEYDFELKRVEVCGDLFVSNDSDTPKSLRFLHRGTIKFDNLADNWFTEKKYTPLLEEFSKQSPDFHLSDGIIVVSPRAVPYKYSLENYLSGNIIRKDCGTQEYVPFSLYETPPIPAHSLGLIRVFGVIKGQSYDRFLGEGAVFPIYGDNLLLEKIDSEDLCIDGMPSVKPLEFEVTYDRKYYISLYKEFKAYKLSPDRYDIVFWNKRQDSILKSTQLSSDLYSGFEKKPLLDRVITWYWSQSPDFLVNGKYNGPHIRVSK